MLRSLLLLFTLGCGLHGLRAQSSAHAGPTHIILLLGDTLPRSTGPISGYRIERSIAGTSNWNPVGEVRPLANVKELQRARERADKAMPYPVFHTTPIDSLWRIVQRGERRYLGGLYNDIPTLLAVGAAWIDSDARPGILYRYRITPSGAPARLTEAVSAGGGSTPTAIVPLNAWYHHHEGRMELNYRMVGGPRAAYFDLWRSDDGAPYTRVQGSARAAMQGDTVELTLSDTSVTRYRPLRYALRAWDPFGNPAPAIDTLYTASLDPTQMPMPSAMSAAGDSSGRGIRIQWRITDHPVVKQLTLLRSTNSVDDFSPVAVLATDRNDYLDENVHHAVPYFYAFLVEYKVTDISMRSHSFAATVYAKDPPQAPTAVIAGTEDDRVVLRWSDPTHDPYAYLVYRAEPGAEMQLAGEPIHTDGAQQTMEWSEPIAALSGTGVYRYAVRTISSSHLQSTFSDTVPVMISAREPLPTPRDTRIRRDGSALLLDWEDLSGTAELLGYQIIRETVRNGRSRVDTLYSPVNFWDDSLQHASELRYRVRTLALHGGHSTFGETATVVAVETLPAAPYGVDARRSAQAVQLQWQAAEGQVVRYAIHRAGIGTEAVRIGTVSATAALQYTDREAPPRGPLFYTVTAEDSEGRSGPHSSVSTVE